jgi:hypothetical protein
MRKITLTLIALFVFSISQAQIIAVTESGEEVILYSDGTWKYQHEGQFMSGKIQTNTIAFKKEKESTFLLKSNKFNVGLYLNPKKWSFTKAVDNPDAEYELKFKDGDLYGMLITEKIEIPIETLKSIAVVNAKTVVSDLKVVKEEYRIVNGFKVLLLQMNGTMKGIKVSYYGYYYSNPNGTVQFITYTSQKLLDNYMPECEKLLNGLVEIN